MVVPRFLDGGVVLTLSRQTPVPSGEVYTPTAWGSSWNTSLEITEQSADGHRSERRLVLEKR